MAYDETRCPRAICPTKCCPLANVVSDGSEGDKTFVCAGYNAQHDRSVKQDRFRHCTRTNDGIDIIQDMDRRDMLDTIYVLSRALSLDECHRVSLGGATDEDLNEMDLVVLERGCSEP